ncbi:MAG: hypothetical protein EBT63_00255 [Proteobacteria bacterium]|nr:hypothetical protein [Pseudomonadota bacterium]NCA28629.1 hypothetical protein [Pseudomonadota bacterium]
MFEQRSLAKSLLLYLFAVVLTIMNLTNINISGFNDVMPMMDLMAVFYFAVFKNIFGLFFIFLLGIWNDALNGNPLGLTSLCYIVLIKFFAILNVRLLNKERFRQIWQQFIYFSIMFLFGKWFLLLIINGQSGSVWNLIVQLIISSVLYIPAHSLFDYLNRKLLGQ